MTLPSKNFKKKFGSIKKTTYLCTRFERKQSFLLKIRGVAQLASASALGAEGPPFESEYPDKKDKGIDSKSVPFFILSHTRTGDI